MTNAVQSILELLNEGLSFDDILRDYYPDLEVEDIQACLQYATDNPTSFKVTK